MKMRPIAVLPALVTLGNAVCGFLSIAIVAKSPSVATPEGLVHFIVAGYLIYLAMVFDGLDGRVARFARVTSDFGGQLDSLSDAISFGVAPAVLAFRMFFDVVPNTAMAGHSFPFYRIAMALGAAYFSCAILRLARFNVENVHDEEAHLSFRGLPSPAAAGAVTSLCILILYLWRDHEYPALANGLLWAMPAVLLVAGLLMVSTIRYIHLINQLIRGRRPLSYLVQIILVVVLLLLLQEKAFAVMFVAYALSGPVILLYRKLTRAGRAAEVRPAQRPGDHPPVS
jgi:CDP-diacylglycerol--serine O-phosphatidyltransferase